MKYYKKINESFNNLLGIKEDIDLDVVPDEEVKKDTLEKSKEYFYALRPVGVWGKEFMILPDGTQLSSMTTEEAPNIDGPQYDASGEEKYNHIVEYFNSLFKDFMDVTESVAVVSVSGLNERYPFLIYLNSKRINDKQYNIIKMNVEHRTKQYTDNNLYFRVYKPNKEFINITRKSGEDPKAFTDKIINIIKNFYGTGSLKEEIEKSNIYYRFEIEKTNSFFRSLDSIWNVFVDEDGVVRDEYSGDLRKLEKIEDALEDIKQASNIFKDNLKVPGPKYFGYTKSAFTEQGYNKFKTEIESIMKALKVLGYDSFMYEIEVNPENIAYSDEYQILFTEEGNYLDTSEITNKIRKYYTTNKLDENELKEDIDHREVYKSLTFSDTPKLGPIFISKEGEFVNVNPEGAHSEIFGDEDYSGDDYYTLHDAFGLIKANSGNKIEPFAYIDIWVVPNHAQKVAIIDWMYFLIENGVKNIQVNTPDSNTTHSLESNIPEDIYDTVVRSL